MREVAPRVWSSDRINSWCSLPNTDDNIVFHALPKETNGKWEPYLFMS